MIDENNMRSASTFGLLMYASFFFFWIEFNIVCEKKSLLYFSSAVSNCWRAENSNSTTTACISTAITVIPHYYVTRLETCLLSVKISVTVIFWWRRENGSFTRYATELPLPTRANEPTGLVEKLSRLGAVKTATKVWHKGINIMNAWRVRLPRW